MYKYIFLIGLVICLFYFQIKSYRNCNRRVCIKTYNLYKNHSKIYPKSHWRYRVSKSCMNCGHKSFITKHWNEDGLFCENCKDVHKGKISKHYLYDAALTCLRCGHKENIPKDHEESGIRCGSCKMSHYNYYNKNVLRKEKFSDK